MTWNIFTLIKKCDIPVWFNILKIISLYSVLVYPQLFCAWIHELPRDIRDIPMNNTKQIGIIPLWCNIGSKKSVWFTQDTNTTHIYIDNYWTVLERKPLFDICVHSPQFPIESGPRGDSVINTRDRVPYQARGRYHSQVSGTRGGIAFDFISATVPLIKPSAAPDNHTKTRRVHPTHTRHNTVIKRH